MKKIGIVIPVYNEEENILDGYKKVLEILKEKCENYDYEFIFIDNCSTDGTRIILRELAKRDKNVKIILNAQNFGWMRSSYYAMIQTTGDCVILLAADMQEPPEMIPEFLKWWERGNRIVIGIKSKSKENRIKYFLRNCYYRFIKKIAEIDHIEQFMGFGLYDRQFIEVLKELKDPLPYLRGIVAELGFSRKELEYTQNKREKGKTHFSLYKIYDLAMLGITSYSKVLLRIATMLGFGVATISVLIAIITLVLKLFNIIEYPIGIAAISIGIFFFGAVQIFFIGLLGEYVLNINTRVMNRPLVVEEERINF